MSDLTPLDKLHILCDDCTTMSEWEMGYIDSVSKWVDQDRRLTTGQEIVIMNIYTERMIDAT